MLLRLCVYHCVYCSLPPTPALQSARKPLPSHPPCGGPRAEAPTPPPSLPRASGGKLRAGRKTAQPLALALPDSLPRAPHQPYHFCARGCPWGSRGEAGKGSKSGLWGPWLLDCEAHFQHLGRIKYSAQEEDSGFQTLHCKGNDFKRLVT